MDAKGKDRGGGPSWLGQGGPAGRCEIETQVWMEWIGG